MVVPVGVYYAAVPVSVIVALGIIRRLRSRRWGRVLVESCLRGKTFIVTGATSGVGLATARALVKRKARVIFAVRDVDRAKTIIADIRKEQPMGGEMIPMHLDLASLDSIESFVELIKAGFHKIDVLVNNAGVAVPLKLDMKTKDGFEINMGVNHLGHFHLTNLLLDHLKRAAPSRVVVVSSALHENATLDLDDINSLKQIEATKSGAKLSRTAGYANSKLMNVYFARAAADRWRDYGIDVHSCCPGFTYTNLFRYSFKWYHYIFMLPVAFLFMRSAEQGAQTVIFCAADYSIEGKTGRFYKDCAEYVSKHQFDPEKSDRFWTLSEQMVKNGGPL